MTRAPIIKPGTLPSPLLRLPPPITTAAITELHAESDRRIALAQPRHLRYAGEPENRPEKL